MNVVMKIFLSMSFSGSMLIVVMLLGKRFLKDRISRQWQYYIWLVMVLRLLLPFGMEINLMGKTYQAVDQAMIQTVPLPQHQSTSNTLGGSLEPDVGALLINNIWLVWLGVALGLFIRKITIYQGFIRYINAGLIPVSDIELLDLLSAIAEQYGIKKPIELSVHLLVSSPLLIGCFRPCIVLSSTDIPKKDFQYIILHELIHYKRRDMFYKWLVQITVCLHWFNPLVHLMSREITKDCEFSCDEAVLAKMGCDNAQDYGQTLLDAMAAVGKYKENHGAVTLSENKQLLKERLGAIMNIRRKSMARRILTGILTICVMFGASFVGVYSVATAANDIIDKPIMAGNENLVQEEKGTYNKDYAAQVEQYYKNDSLPLFEIAFARLNESDQRTWIEKLYADGDFAFFSVAARAFDKDDPFLTSYAEKAYADGAIAFFSMLTDRMDKAELEAWLNKALEDDCWDFQSILFDKLGMSDEKDAKEKEWTEQQMAEYQAVGITMDDKNYYYQGELIYVFLDIRANESFYTLNTNPSGTVNVKIIRDANDKIVSISYMTETEVMELLGDISDPDDDWE